MTSHPLLRDPTLAAILTHLIVHALLRAYQYGARMAHAAIEQRGDIAPGALEQVAERSREQARAREHSARLLLEHIHDVYDIARTKKCFVDPLRLYPLELIELDLIRKVRVPKKPGDRRSLGVEIRRLE